MAVREFNGSTDLLSCATGAASGVTFGTTAAIVKLQGSTTFRQVSALHNSGGTFLATMVSAESSDHWEMFAGSSSASAFTTATGVWYLVVVRKATGSATPRFSTYNFGSTVWSHGAGGAALSNWTAPGASGSIQFSFENGSGDQFNGRVAARAIWSNVLPWTADASGDTAIEGAGLEDAASSWLSNNPSAFWLFNQASIATPVDDLSTTGTADQTSITGTTVINGDDPPGFDFTLTAADPATPLAKLQRWPVRMGRWPRPQIATGDPTVVAATNAPADVATAVGTAPFDTAGGSISLNLISDSPIIATGTAYDATVSTAPSTNAPAGNAAATGTANNPTIKVSPTPTTATAAGVANNATVSTSGATNASAGLASATGTANDATIKIAPSPATATGTGIANNATVQTGSFTNASAGLASATGTANNPSVKVATGPSTATATGTANNPSVTTGGTTNAQAQVATATGTVNNPTVTRSANAAAGVALAVGTVSAVSLQIRANAEAAAGLAAAFDVTISGAERNAQSVAAVTARRGSTTTTSTTPAASTVTASTTSTAAVTD